ncbi:ferredoxin--nitrite reductase, chloroplastic isoform X1 [Oryza glaberrima]|uniref:ferredoxin--nitrite reductase, chloroplastic isoform X1 n=1 Tax=Oryza glaberrima TaxID=4538 RepID=UPI00224C2551|nr:ferredoxin--nitrite reductase, chloroplastic isoform X1 [Oryza glaberrima]
MASSASLQRFLPPYPHAAASRCRPPGVRARPVQSSTVSAPSSSTPAADEAVSAERLEPRVEQREGRYWVLKEKYRTGLNPQEKVKLGKEPMSLFMEGGIKELAKMPMEEIEADKLSKEDIDVRLKWLGLFHRRKHQYGRFMMRLKLPNGVTTSEQTRYLASVIEAYGKEGCADVTTRQNWQIRGVTLPDVPAILDGLNAVGLTSLQSGMDNVRNPVGNPLAGIDPDEIVDTRSYTNLLSSYITSNFQGNPTITNLPRKWNVCVIGSHDLYEHPHINDLAYMPAVKGGKFGFNLLVGGFISPKRWEEALPLDAWVPGDDIIPVCKAVLEAYRDLGTRGNRQKTRMMWLIDELVSLHSSTPLTELRMSQCSYQLIAVLALQGMEAFRSEVEKRMPNGVLERAAPDDLIDKKWQRRDYLGVHPQKQEGMSYVGLHVPVGRVQAADMFELARLADEYGSGELRLTVEQNIVIPNVKNEKVEALLAEPLLQKFSPQPSLLLKGLVACTGNQFCGQAIIETKQRALLVTSQVEKLVSVPRAVRMHWTGCPNSCGQVQVADIGFMGCLTKDSTGKIVEAADIFVGGRVGSDSHLAGAYKKSVPCDELAPIVADILVERFGAVRREREEDEE